MAANLDNVMTWEQACRMYRDIFLPVIREKYEQDGLPDWPARREAWNNWTDSLCKNNRISDWQYNNWSQSPECGD